MRIAAYAVMIALAGLAGCARPDVLSTYGVGLDHTSSAMITDRGQCACLARARLKALAGAPCASRWDGQSCGLRLDCVAPGSPEPLRSAVARCEPGG